MKTELLCALFGEKDYQQRWLMDGDELQTMVNTISNLRPEMIGEKMRAAAGAPLLHQEPKHTVIRVEGPIVRRHAWYSEWIGACSTEEVMESVYRAERIGKPVIGVIATPGGDAASVGECADAWASLTAPLIMYTGTYAQSAGMWWYSKGDLKLAHETALLGSIGVRTSFYDSDTDSVIVSNNAENKLGTREEAVRIINDIETLMIKSIAEGYGTTSEKVIADFGRGASFVAVEAKERGMVDKFATLQTIPLQAGDLMKLNKDDIAAIDAAGGLEAVLASIGRGGDNGADAGTTTTIVGGAAVTTTNAPPAAATAAAPATPAAATPVVEGAAPATPAVPATPAAALPAGQMDAGTVQQMITDSNNRQLKILGHPLAKIDYDLCLSYAQSNMDADTAVSLLDRTMKTMGHAARPTDGDRTIENDLSGDEQLDSLIASGADYDDGLSTGGTARPAASSTAHEGKGSGQFRDMSQVADSSKLTKQNAAAAGDRIAKKMIANGGGVVALAKGA